MSYSKLVVDEKSLDSQPSETFDFSKEYTFGRNPEFFNSFSLSCGPFDLRRVYNYATKVHTVFIQKRSSSPDWPATYLQFTGKEIPEVLRFIDFFLMKIDSTEYHHSISFLQFVPSGLKSGEMEFWKREYCLVTGSEKIKVRPRRLPNGVYQIKILQVSDDPDRLGNQISMFVGQARAFYKALSTLLMETEEYKEIEKPDKSLGSPMDTSDGNEDGYDVVDTTSQEQRMMRDHVDRSAYSDICDGPTVRDALETCSQMRLDR